MKILTISNMYPSKKDPVYGTFVKNFYDFVRQNNKDGRNDLIVIKGREKSKLKKLCAYIRFYTKLLWVLSKQKYDLVYVHTITFPIIPIRIVSSYRSIPIVFNVHGRDVLTRGKIAANLKKIAIPLIYKAKLIVSPSEYFKKVLLHQFPNLSPEKIFISPSGGIRKEFYNERIIEPKDILTLGYVSRIDHDKGWEVLINAIIKLKKEGISIKLVMAGRGSEEQKLKNAITTNHLENQVTFLGPIGHDKLPQLYSSFDLFIFPTITDSESLGLVGLEAMASSVPVIASDIGGPGSYVENGYNGFKFLTGSSDELYSTIVKYINLPDKYKTQMQKNAYNFALSYESSHVAEELYNKIKEL